MPAPKLPSAIDHFLIDPQLLMLLPRAGASLRHPEMRPLTLRNDPDGYYLEQHLNAGEQTSEIDLTRRIFLTDLTATEATALEQASTQIAFETCRRKGISQGLTNISERRWERLFAGIMTFLNPRQMNILLYLYRLAAQQQRNTVLLTSNELLQDFGYTRTKDGGFASKLRSQLHRDLVALHRTELVYTPVRGKARRAKVKPILQIKAAQITNGPRQFDIFRAADHTYELADQYSISLEFTDGLKRHAKERIYLHGNLDMTQPIGSNAKNDYKTRLLIYLASQLLWQQPSDGEYLVLPKQTVFQNLDLFGRNGSRNNQIFWRTVETLKALGYLLSAQELPGKKKTNSLQFQLNSEQLHR